MATRNVFSIEILTTKMDQNASLASPPCLAATANAKNFPRFSDEDKDGRTLFCSADAVGGWNHLLQQQNKHDYEQPLLLLQSRARVFW
jgi:hypothetical protein